DRTRDAVDAGVVLLAGTDSGGVLGHGIIHDELDELARAGLTGTQILEAAAWAPRSFLRAPGLEDGAPADLLVVPRDPRRDHRALRERTHVVLDGRIVADCDRAPRPDPELEPHQPSIPACAPGHTLSGGTGAPALA